MALGRNLPICKQASNGGEHAILLQNELESSRR